MRRAISFSLLAVAILWCAPAILRGDWRLSSTSLMGVGFLLVAAAWCLRDVQEEVNSQQARQRAGESERHLSQLMLQARALLFEADVDAPSDFLRDPRPERLRWYTNPLDAEAVKNLLGLEPPANGPFYLEHITSQRHPEDEKRAAQLLTDTVNKRLPSYTQEYRCRDGNNCYQWLSETVFVTYVTPTRWHMVGFIHDISAQKRAEDSLQDVMRHAQCIIFYGTLRLDDPSKEHLWNIRVTDLEAAQRVVPLNLSQDDYPRTWVRARHPEDLEASAIVHRKAISSGASRISHTFRVIDRHGQWHWISEEVCLEPVQPKMYKVVTVCVDITAQKQTEEALHKAMQAAEEANAAKSAFLANMSHEIRTPMTAILGYTDLLIDSSSPEERETYALTIRRNGEHLMTVLNDILDLSRIESGKLIIQLSPCSPKQIAQDVVSMFRSNAMDKMLDLELHADRDVPEWVNSDSVRLRQILVNLVGNAIKFTEAGSVTVRLSIEKHTQLRIDVADTGLGISNEQIPMLFQPFQQADISHRRRFGGTGLGLAICRRLAMLLGGEVSVQSQFGSGSTFSVLLPLAAVPGASTTIRRDYSRVTRLDGVSVLLAEDSSDNRRLVTIHLRKLGCKVMGVENGAEACEMALASETAARPFDVILMDMQMPVLDGYSACARLREQGYKRPIIAITAHAMEGDRARCVAAGCTDYVVKPIDIAVLSRTILENARRPAEQAPAARELTDAVQ